MFWSGETLAKRLPSLIDKFDPDRIDCAAYTLAVGNEFYVSPTKQSADPKKDTLTKLDKGESFKIPPGQFAFVLSDEEITIPDDAMALISVRSSIKFRGLVSVSGFHADPGYRGQLTFAVFNAGPRTVHLKRGDAVFLIWFAKLDCETERKKNEPIRRGLDPQMIMDISGELQSFESLKSKIEDGDKELDNRVRAIEKEQNYYRAIAAIVFAVAIGFLVHWLKDNYPPRTWGTLGTYQTNSAPETNSAPTTPAK